MMRKLIKHLRALYFVHKSILQLLMTSVKKIAGGGHMKKQRKMCKKYIWALC
jgi:hypothetical protein